uniref:Protein kinase domain-containing protein n=1 Tax=Ditylum brightwellii TaxID=49249 RepID=A0A6U3VGS8_9STRA|mmetsp:Transcript_14111/g.21165  ORF Transcript_14111/g.21165 Transcript_14111/m.21165 type:complete len:494 (+) Transcript_14111:414-1895(+)
MLSSSTPATATDGDVTSLYYPTSSEYYELLGRIGRGAFATVWKARLLHHPHINITDAEDGGGEKEDVLCAVKILELECVDTNFVDIRLEVQTMRLSSHPNILPCHAAFVNDTSLWLVTPFMKKGSSLRCLQNARAKLGRRKRTNDDGKTDLHNDFDDVNDDINIDRDELLLEDHITYILHETLLGLRYIHENGQIHRDIKAGNILLDGNGDVRIADFGVSGWLDYGGSRRSNANTFVGTPCWMAPEVMEQVHGYDYKADIWSLGITALELAKGYAPYAKYEPMKVLLLTIQEDPPSLETYQDCADVNKWSKSFRAMIKLCLQKDPKKRPTCEELLSHTHFKEFSTPEFGDIRRAKIKTDLCDLVEDVGGSTSSSGANAGCEQPLLPGVAPVCVISSTEENRAAGTTWVFSDGSQVLASSSACDDSADDANAFYDEFERTTAGEDYMPSRQDATVHKSNVEATIQQQQKEDMNDFFDEFEKTTAGENFSRKTNS